MRVGVKFPTTEFGADPGAIKEWTQAVERMGFAHISAIDHVVGANAASRPGWDRPYDLTSQMYEPLVLFSYMAGITTTIGFMSAILVLPQRQTVLVAKQAACLDALSGGRLRLGCATGWNEVEYEALGVDFADRGRIFDDQIGVLRALWTQPAVTVDTPFHKITDAGINPLPVQRPIPLWFGGGGTNPISGKPSPEAVVKRVARLADGWWPHFASFDEGAEMLATMKVYAAEYGRDPAQIGLEGALMTSQGEDGWEDQVVQWRKLGATHLTIVTTFEGLTGPEQHLRRLEQVTGALSSLEGWGGGTSPRPAAD